METDTYPYILWVLSWKSTGWSDLLEWNQISPPSYQQQPGPYSANTDLDPPKDYSSDAWIACLCCFWPTGLLAIMKAYESRDAVARGDFLRAHSAAKLARIMVRISWIVGIVAIVSAVVYLLLFITLKIKEVKNDTN